MAEIVGMDVYGVNYTGCPRTPNTLTNAKTAYALLLVMCGTCHDNQHTSRYCDLDKSFQSQDAWLHQFTADMPHIDSVYVKINSPWPLDSAGIGAEHFKQWPRSPYSFDLAKALEPFTEIPRIAKPTVVAHTVCQMAEASDGLAADALVPDESPRHICWTREGGWDDLCAEHQEARRDYPDLDGFEYRSIHADSEDEDEDESEEGHQEQND
ncbi:hypothetical protein AC579_4667 [Pseudocercospora musae]|uniref:Uncharacterized protein n=1 Tax=Pseudocercospora musae TaxID=113226 RepID=A0A139I2F4_9PEZI|nr:hypothetical protein AC579_4667 [Pseudocercospora musae]